MMQKSEGQKATEEFRQDAAPLEAKTDRLEAVAERRNESDVMARAVRVGPALPTCFVAEKDQDRAPLRTPQELQLLADGTAVADAGGKEMHGTWVEVSGDSVQVLLGSGEVGMELRLERTATGLLGTFGQGAGDASAVDADAGVGSPLVLIRLRMVDCEAAR